MLLSIITLLLLVIASGTPTMADPDKDEARGKEHRQGRDDRKYRERWDDRRHHERHGHREHHERHGHRRHHDGHSYFHQHGYRSWTFPPAICPHQARAASGIPAYHRDISHPPAHVGACAITSQRAHG